MATKPKTLADFKAAHDPNVIVPNKIRVALAAIEKEGPENWLYEADFLKLSGLSTTQLAMFRDQFAAHIVEAAGTRSGKSAKRVYFGNAKVAAKLRG
jgi:hypothetical protein